MTKVLLLFVILLLIKAQMNPLALVVEISGCEEFIPIDGLHVFF